MIKRTDKLTALTAFFAGRPAQVKQLAGMPRKRIEDMSDAELEALIEAGTAKPCPDYEAMSDEQLQALIDKANR